MNSLEILDRLISFPTVSRDSNLDLISFLRDLLDANGLETRLVHNADRTKANLFARIGPTDQAGVLLSGHSDVVPVEGQSWTSDPFRLSSSGGSLFGRGTADMKGFIACATRAALSARARRLTIPLWLAISYDEEIGCIGVRGLIDKMLSEEFRPLLCIVGEPTSMKVATGHKGKTALVADCTGRSAHSAFAPKSVNALHLACDFVGVLRDEQSRLESTGARDDDYEIPFTTIHAARIRGGIAPNIVPDQCSVEFEIRHLSEDNPAKLVQILSERGEAVAKAYRGLASEAQIEIRLVNHYPGLSTGRNESVVRLISSLTGMNDTIKVAFGTEGGLFREKLNSPTVVCGPGSMEQGHKGDEFLSMTQIEQCDAMLDALVERLETGL